MKGKYTLRALEQRELPSDEEKKKKRTPIRCQSQFQPKKQNSSFLPIPIRDIIHVRF
jgi:hypothetical protein